MNPTYEELEKQVEIMKYGDNYSAKWHIEVYNENWKLKQEIIVLKGQLAYLRDQLENR